MKALLLVVLVACSPAYHAATKRCPTTTMVITDFVLASAALALAGLHASADKPIRATTEAALGVAIWLGANHAEIACAR